MQSYNSNLLHKIRQCIKNGGIIAYPTEHCYGFGCDPFNYTAINQLLKIKRRDKAKGLIVVAGTIGQLDRLIMPLALPDVQNLRAYWPGFYSILMPKTNAALKILTGKHSKISVRVSRHPLIGQLCKSLNMALVSTSANYSGHRVSKTYRDCSRKFGKKMLVLPGVTNFAKKPSVIIDWYTQKILR